MPLSIPLQRAGRIIRSGGVVAYPTEGVWGLGCLPHAEYAVRQILEFKQRDAGKGLILIAADTAQLAEWVDPSVDVDSLTSTADHPLTWIVPPAVGVPFLIRGYNEGVAVRVTRHPIAAALCRGARSAIVSTSANISGRPSARSILVLRRTFGHLVDCVVAGPIGSARGPSEIREWHSGETIRPAGK
jgi:L-threonylcarbamoyladenylate synthase